MDCAIGGLAAPAQAESVVDRDIAGTDPIASPGIEDASMANSGLGACRGLSDTKSRVFAG